MIFELELKKRVYLTGLSAELLREILDYDAETGQFHWKISPSYKTPIGSPAGSIKAAGYICIQIFGRSYLAHKLAWLYVFNEWVMIDHKDHNKANNIITNLRPTTYQLNAANRQYVGNNTGVKGVYERDGKFHAGIKVDGKRFHLGTFETLEEAKAIRIAKAREIFGDHAYEE